MGRVSSWHLLGGGGGLEGGAGVAVGHVLLRRRLVLVLVHDPLRPAPEVFKFKLHGARVSEAMSCEVRVGEKERERGWGRGRDLESLRQRGREIGGGDEGEGEGRRKGGREREGERGRGTGSQEGPRGLSSVER
eukprot:825833-Rhodomonas_salina.1